MTGEATARATVRQAGRDALRFDRAQVSLRAGLVAAAPVVAVLALGTLLGQPVAAITMGAGAMLGGVAWRAAGPQNPPVATMAAAVVGLGVATVAGSASGGHPWLHLALLIVLCGFAGLLVSLGRRGTVPGTQAIIAYVVFGRFPEPLGSAAALAGLVAAGGAVQAAFAALVALPPAWRLQRQALAAAYRELATVAGDPARPSAPAAAALDEAEARLNAPTLLGDPELMTLSSLLEEGRRIRLELIAFSTRRAPAPDPSDVLPVPVAEILTSVAAAIADPGAARKPLPEVELARDAGADQRLAALAGQLHAAMRLAGAARPEGRGVRPHRGSRRPLAGARADLHQLRANASLRTAAGRHAARLAIVVAVAELIVQHSGLPRGYWVVVAAATVLRPEFGATFTRGAERMAGTVAGVVVASLIAVALDPSGWGNVLVIGVLATGTYAVFPASFAAGIALLTAVVVFLLHPVAPASVTLALDRGLDSLIGGALGLLAYAVWPTWSGGSTSRLLAELVDAQRAYVVAVLDAVIGGTAPEQAELRPLARRARIAWSNADAVITLARTEPARGSGPAGERALAALAGLRRLVYAGHTLRLEAGSARARRPHPGLAPLRDGLDRALLRLAAQLRATPVGSPPPQRRTPASPPPPPRRTPASPSLPPRRTPATPPPPVRDLLDAARAVGTLDPALLAPLDELVDATNTVAATVGAVAA